MAFVRAISVFTPSSGVMLSNENLQKEFPDVEVAKIAKGVGVERRYVADEHQTASDLAFEAACNLWKECDISPQIVDFIIFSTQSPDYFLPSTACVLQHRLGIPTTAGAFDFDLGCSGYAYGLAMAKSFVDSGLAANVLLLTGDTISKYLHPKDKNRILFGDGATATLISESGFAEIGLSVYGTDGSGAENLIVKNGAARHFGLTGRVESDESGNIKGDDYFYMDGEAIFNFTIERVPKLIDDTLSRNKLQKDDIDLFVFHQANKFMLNTIRKVCGISKDKFYINLENMGNTTSSTIPIALKECIQTGVLSPGMRVMVAGYGVGLSWSATILKF